MFKLMIDSVTTLMTISSDIGLQFDGLALKTFLKKGCALVGSQLHLEKFRNAFSKYNWKETIKSERLIYIIEESSYGKREVVNCSFGSIVLSELLGVKFCFIFRCWYVDIILFSEIIFGQEYTAKFWSKMISKQPILASKKICFRRNFHSKVYCLYAPFKYCRLNWVLVGVECSLQISISIL